MKAKAKRLAVIHQSSNNEEKVSKLRETYVANSERYAEKEYSRCGRSGLVLPRISLGYWHNFGDTTPLDRQREITLSAFDMGITYFDLANNYGPPYGSAEVNFGTVFSQDLRPYRDEMIIASKAGFDMWPGPYGEWPSRKNMLASLDQSLRRLQVDYVDIFYAHRPDPRIPIEETVGALATAYQQGKALYVGISNYYTPAEVDQVVAALGAWNIPLTINQLRYSMLDRRIENGVLDALAEAGSGVALFSPLEQGLLTDRYLKGVPTDSRAAVGHFLKSQQITEEYLQTAEKLNEVAQERGQSLAQLALSWALRDQRITTAIVGASSVAQLQANVAAADGPALTDEELAAIDAAIGVPIQR